MKHVTRICRCVANFPKFYIINNKIEQKKTSSDDIKSTKDCGPKYFKPSEIFRVIKYTDRWQDSLNANIFF